MNTILARNLLPQGCDEARLNKYFSAIGPVSKIIIDTAAKSAKIAFRNTRDAQKALSHDGKLLLGAYLQLSLAPQSISLKRSRSRSRSRSISPPRRIRRRSPSPQMRRSRSRSPPRIIDRSRRRSRSRSRSASPRNTGLAWARRSRSRSRSISPRRRSRSRSRSISPRRRSISRSRSISPARRSESDRRSACLTDLLDGTTEDIIRTAVIESLNNSAEPFNSVDITSISLDNPNRIALVNFSDEKFAAKFKDQHNVMIFGKLIPICDASNWKGDMPNSMRDNQREVFLVSSDPKALEALIDPATLQYVTDTLKCNIMNFALDIGITLRGPNVQEATKAMRDSIAQRFPSK